MLYASQSPVSPVPSSVEYWSISVLALLLYSAVAP